MKRLLLLLCALLMMVAVSSSPLLASSKSIEYRVHSLMAFFCRSLFPVSGIYFVPEEIQVVNGGADERVGGDADDYANGKISPGPDEQKPAGGKLESSSVEPKGSTRGSIKQVR